MFLSSTKPRVVVVMSSNPSGRVIYSGLSREERTRLKVWTSGYMPGHSIMG